MKIILAAFVGMLGMTLGTANATTVGIVPENSNASLGSPVQVDLDISGINDGTTPELGAWDITIAFDPSILSFSSASFGTGLDVFGLGDIQATMPAGNGALELYEIALDSTADLDALQASSFSLATLYFNTIALGTSALDITINSLSDGPGDPIVASAAAGGVTVAGPVPVPLPSSTALILAALLGAAIAFRMGRMSAKVNTTELH